MNNQPTPPTRWGKLRFYTALLFGVALYLAIPWALSLVALAQSTPLPSKYVSAPFSDNEVLRYSVHWSFVRLGSIELRQSSGRNNSGPTTAVQLSARSASGLPFIDVNVRDRSVLNPRDPRCTDFTVRKDHDPQEVKKYRFDPSSKTLSMEVSSEGLPPVSQQRTEHRVFYDALGMLMLLRGMAGSGEQITVPLLMDFEIVHSKAELSRAIEEVDVPAFDDDVPAYHIALRSSWEDESVGGLRGDIDLWCSTDAAAIPLRIEMSLALGSIVIELESCKRPGWRLSASAELPAKGNGGVR